MAKDISDNMRRNDKQITNRNTINQIIENNTICRIAFSENNIPYIVPMNYGYKDNSLYLHSAQEGKKINALKKNNQICFEITDSIEIVQSENPCDFVTKYRSVIGFGKILPVSDYDKKINALKIIMKHHTNKGSWNFNKTMVDTLLILKIEIESLTGKKSGL